MILLISNLIPFYKGNFVFYLNFALHLDFSVCLAICRILNKTSSHDFMCLFFVVLQRIPTNTL